FSLNGSGPGSEAATMAMCTRTVQLEKSPEVFAVLFSSVPLELYQRNIGTPSAVFWTFDRTVLVEIAEPPGVESTDLLNVVPLNCQRTNEAFPSLSRTAASNSEA